MNKKIKLIKEIFISCLFFLLIVFSETVLAENIGICPNYPALGDDNYDIKLKEVSDCEDGIRVIKIPICNIDAYLYVFNQGLWKCKETEETEGGILEQKLTLLKNSDEYQANIAKSGAVFCLGAASHEGKLFKEHDRAENRANTLCKNLWEKSDRQYFIINLGQHKKTDKICLTSGKERPIAFVLFLKKENYDNKCLKDSLLKKLIELHENGMFPTDINNYDYVRHNTVEVERYISPSN